MNSRINRYWDLRAWQKAMGLAKTNYEITSTFSKAERYGLVLE